MNRWRRWVQISGIVVTCSWAGCVAPTAGGKSEPLGSNRAALAVPGTAPVPCDANQDPTWQGSTVQLMVADAWAECAIAFTRDASGAHYAFPELQEAEYVSGLEDEYLAELAALMSTTAAEELAIQGDPLRAWLQMRDDEGKNCDASADNRFTRVELEPIGPGLILGDPPINNNNHNEYEADIRSATVNVCIAQRLRQSAPGASGAEALLMSNEEQRELLAVVRERSQIAALQYALIGVILAQPRLWEVDDEQGALAIVSEAVSGSNPPGTPRKRILYHQFEFDFRSGFTSGLPIGVLEDFLGGNCLDNKECLAADWGKDFAIAVQLNVAATEELGELIARSRSAGLPTPSEPVGSTVADRVWGEGSWQQRLAALFYGGDPFEKTYPGVDVAGAWWTRDFSPYATTRVQEPQVYELLKLARHHDILRLRAQREHSTSACDRILVDESADDIYFQIQTKLCQQDFGFFWDAPSNTCVTGRTKDPLLEHHRITREHAQTLAGVLADLVGPRLGAVPANNDATVRICRTAGNRDFVGRLERSSYEADNKRWIGFSKDFDSSPRLLDEVRYTSYANMRFPLADSVFARASAEDQGFSAVSVLNTLNADDIKRRLGAAAALHQIREMVTSVTEAPTPPNAQNDAIRRTVFAQAPAILKLIDAAVGRSGISLSPNIVSAPNNGGNLLVHEGSWRARLLTDAQEDPFWIPPSPGQNIRLVVVPSSEWSSGLLKFPRSNVFGRTGRMILREGLLTGNGGQLSSMGNGRWELTSMGVPQTASGGAGTPLSVPNLVLVAFRGNSATDLDALSDEELPDHVRILGDGFRMQLPRVSTHVRGDPFTTPSGGLSFVQGLSLSTGGRFGRFVKQQLTPLPDNPSVPAYDAFGLPTNWVPPFSAELLGGNSLESSVQHFLNAADRAASDSASAVQTAFAHLLEEQKETFTNQIARDAARAREEQGLREARGALCGLENQACNVTIATTRPQEDWYSGLVFAPECEAGPELDAMQDPGLSLVDPGGNLVTIVEEFFDVDVLADNAERAAAAAEEDAENAITQVKCIARHAIDSFLGTELPLAAPVANFVTVDSVPSFQEFAGGALQSAFIEQWRAIRAPNEQFDVISKSVDAMSAKIEAANAVLARETVEVRRQCSAAAFARAVSAGWSVSFPAFSMSFNNGPLLAQDDRCKTALLNVEPGIKQAAAANKDAVLGAATAVVGLIDKQAAMALSGAHIQQLVTEANLEVERVEMEGSLAEASVVDTTSFGLVRRLRNADMWRAKALLEGARRYGLAARRAIEAHYVVDLSELTQDEVFVTGPASWADEIYEYDLSLPAAIGLEVAPQGGDAVVSDKIGDYVRNLRAFVDGYGAKRPAAVAHDEIEVVNIPGLVAGAGNQIDFVNDEGTLVASQTLFGERGAWQVRCENGDWFPLPETATPLSTVCSGAPPIGARLNLELDPWGRLNDGVAHPPYRDRFNGRWDRLAVNLVGTGVKDCTLASDPLGCYGEGFIRYRLTHIGAPWVTDYDGIWRFMGLPPGVVEGGKALAAELWLDPLRDGWDTQYIGAVARTEFAFRPLGGEYRLELEVGPEVRLDRIERVQLLIGSNYWVAQR
jgi:hypothetical protein